MNTDIPKILWKTHILVIDYNTFHYTSLDVFRTILLNREFADALLPEYRSFFRMRFPQQAKFFFENQTNRDLYQLFSLHAQKQFPMDMYDLIDRYQTFSSRVYTDTDLNTYLHAALQSNTIDKISILRHPDDTTPLNVPGSCRIFRTKGLFNAEIISSFINSNHINAVILDSVDLALEISEKTENVTFLFGTYRYNFEYDHTNGLRYLKRMNDMTTMEIQQKHEYGRFDPIRALTKISKEDPS